MSRFTYAIEIDRPVEQVFEYLNNPDNLKQWIGGLVEATTLTDDGPGVGAKMRQVLEENGRKIEMLEETLVYEPNRRIKIMGTTDMFAMTADYTLNRLGKRTRLDYESEVMVKGLLLRLLDPFIAKSGRKKIAEDFARLKEQIEAL